MMTVPALFSQKPGASQQPAIIAFIAALAILAGCGADESTSEAATVADVTTNVPETAKAESLTGDTGCDVIDSRGWAARVVANDAGERRLEVSGEVDLPTPAYTVSWSEGPADRRMPPAQHLILELQAPAEMVTQVVTSESVRYEGEATYAEYRAILVRCGDGVLASITDIDQPAG